VNHNVSVQIPLLGWPRRRHISRLYARIGPWSAIARKILKVRSLNGRALESGSTWGERATVRETRREK
jgi:hypothetical protein